jgi:hypothetical protein
MLVKSAITGQLYHVTWQYEDEWGEPCKTFCLISEVKDDVGKVKDLIVKGIATCSYKDQFDKNKGRKLSMSRALIEERPQIPEPTKENPQVWGPVFAREVRQEFWDAYFKMHGKKE